MSSPLPDQQGFAVSGHDLADIFRRHYNQLVHATAPVCLAISCELYTDGWISQTTKNTTASSGLEAANTIVKELETNLKTRLKNDPGAILKLCNCLEISTEAANFKTITQSIREEIEQCKHPDLHKHQSGQHCEPLTTARRTTQHKPRSRQQLEQHEMEKQYAEEKEPKKEEEEAEEEEEENVPKKKEPLLLQETIKLQAIKKNQEKEKELKEPEDMKYKHIEKDSEDFFLLGLLNSFLKDNRFIEANYSPFFNLNKDSKDDANRTITCDFAVLGERLITIEQTLSALNTHVADRDKTVSATITELSQSVNELKAKLTEGMQQTMETMKAMMEEMKKPRFVSHQEFDGLPDLPGPQDGSMCARVSAETDAIR